MTSKKSNINTKNKVSKAETITIRVSKEIRHQLKLFSKENHKNESQLIRQLIETGLSHFHHTPNHMTPLRGKSIEYENKIEQNKWPDHEKPISKLIFAMSLILTIDTGKKTTEIIKLLHNHSIGIETKFDANHTRIEWENYYLKLRDVIISKISPSKTALVVLDTMILSFLSLVYPSPVFMSSKLSMLMIDSYDNLLEMKEANQSKLVIR